MSIDLLKRIVESYDEGGYRWMERLGEQIEEARTLIASSVQIQQTGVLVMRCGVCDDRGEVDAGEHGQFRGPCSQCGGEKTVRVRL